MGKNAVVILHGFNSTPIFMKGMEYELRIWGKVDHVYNLPLYGSKWGILPNKYNLTTPIVRLSEEGPKVQHTIVQHVMDQMREQVDDDIEEIIFLGHSMGGLVWRAIYKLFVHDHPTDWLDRPSPEVKAIIQLATPNQGSQLTNMRVIQIFDNLQSSLFLKIAGFSINLIRKIGNSLGLTDADEYKYEIIEDSTQIKQMKPESDFLKWLNTQPTFVDEVPHYRLIGRRNGVFFTNLAWMDSPDEFSREDLVEELKQADEDKSVEEILNNYNFPEQLEDDQLMEFIKQIEDEDVDTSSLTTKSTIDQVMSLFKTSDVIPNDGLVSVEDAALPGSIELSLGEFTNKISHHSICMWFLPFKPYRYVRDTVFKTIETELGLVNPTNF